MEGLQASIIRKLPVQHNMIPSYASSNGGRSGPRLLSYTNHPSSSSREFRIFTGMMCTLHPIFCGRTTWRFFAVPASLDEEPSLLPEGENLNNVDDGVLNNASDKLLSKRLTSDELKALLADSERRKLIRKLSEANHYNRYLKRQLHIEEDALTKFKNELAVLELELQALVRLAEEIANSSSLLTTRKINGKYIQSHLLSRLEAVHDKIKEQIKDVDSLKFEEVTVYWVGMAESVKVMGSFDGWTQGEELSPEYSGDYARFSTTLKLRPGRYEIKFLVDGEWQLSPEFPIVGEGVLKNNLLVV